jgi:RNA polymerase sigma-70 factor (ECF subfamily)
MTAASRLDREAIEQAIKGDAAARSDLLEQYRDGLRKMVKTRLDRRIAPRVDASDVVQETMTVAANRLDEYAQGCPLSFFGWLRQIAAERVIDTHRRHLGAQSRSVFRETRLAEVCDDSAMELDQKLVADDTSPSNHLLREERRERVMGALAELSARDREVLVMRHLERLRSSEIAEALGITEGAVESRLLRALMRFRGLLEADQ